VSVQFEGGVQRAEGPVSRLVATRMHESPPKCFYNVYAVINSRYNSIYWWDTLIWSGGVVVITDTQSQALVRGDLLTRREIKESIQAVMDAAKDVTDGWFIKCGTCSTCCRTKHSKNECRLLPLNDNPLYGYPHHKFIERLDVGDYLWLCKNNWELLGITTKTSEIQGFLQSH
jgi:hypothetical protein